MKKFEREIEAFIKDFVKDLREKNVCVFAGAGLSKQAGYVNWPDLLRDIADEIGLSVDVEHDLISLAQYHVNESGGSKAKIVKKILEEFSEQAEETQNHKILSRLPISAFWTTNYDTLIEDSLKKVNKIVDVKYDVDQLSHIKPKRDAVVYKMHGDVNHPSKSILTKEQYEEYYRTHEFFITALSGDLISKTFLFLGFSFTDPNLDYVLSRLRLRFHGNMRQHYTFMKKVTQGRDSDEIYTYNIRKQELRVNDLKRYGIKVLMVDDYDVITDVLIEIENRFKTSTVFISGSAEDYGHIGKEAAQVFIHKLSKEIITNGFNIVNGFGWGVGSAVINGSLEGIYEKPDKFSQDQLTIRPFPQFETGKKKLPELWQEYRENMISLAGVILIVFGNKKVIDATSGNEVIVNADGVFKEFEIAIAKGLVPIPVPSTGFVAKEIYEKVLLKKDQYFINKDVIPFLEKLADNKISEKEIIEIIIDVIKKINI